MQGFADTQLFVSNDNILDKFTVTSIVSSASQTATPGLLMTLNATAPGGFAAGAPSYVPNLPIVPFGTTTVVTVSAIDFGFTTGTTAAGSSTVLVPDSSLFQVGQSIIIGGAGNATKTQPLFTLVSAVTNATTIRVSPVCAGALDHAPIGSGNAFGADLVPLPTQFGPSAYSSNVHVPYLNGGLGSVFDARQGTARGIALFANTGVIGTSGFTVTGYDVYGQLMTETMTALGTVIAFGAKAFKYISFITALSTGAATFSFGASDVVGVNLRAEIWDIVRASYSSVRPTLANGFTAALALSAAGGATAGDVRGTYQISTAGPLGTSLRLAPTNGTSRFYMAVETRVPNLLRSGPSSVGTAVLFGQTQT
jgi:hypothetical protein